MSQAALTICEVSRSLSCCWGSSWPVSCTGSTNAAVLCVALAQKVSGLVTTHASLCDKVIRPSASHDQGLLPIEAASDEYRRHLKVPYQRGDMQLCWHGMYLKVATGSWYGCAGIKERFGDDIFEYLDTHGQMEVTWPSSDPASGGKKTWLLTKQVLIPFAHKCSWRPCHMITSQFMGTLLAALKISLPSNYAHCGCQFLHGLEPRCMVGAMI